MEGLLHRRILCRDKLFIEGFLYLFSPHKFITEFFYIIHLLSKFSIQINLLSIVSTSINLLSIIAI